MKHEFHYESHPETVELEANLEYATMRTKALGDLINVLQKFKPDIEKYGINPCKFHDLFDHLCEELLGTETERNILESDIKFLKGEGK